MSRKAYKLFEGKSGRAKPPAVVAVGGYRKMVDPNFRDTEGRSHLLISLMQSADDDSAFVEHAIRNGCDVNLEDKKGRFPVLMVASKGHAQSLKVLIQHGAAVDKVAKCGRTALMLASQAGYLQCMQALIAAGANVNTTTSNGETALHYAAASGQSQAVELLLKYKTLINYPNKEENTSVILACKAGHVDVVKRLLAAGAKLDKVDAMGRTALHWAAVCGNREMARTLTHGKADLDLMDKTFCNAFILSIVTNNAPVLAELIAAGCDKATIDGLNGTALALAALKGHNECIKVLLDAGEDPDDYGYFSMTPMMAAAYESHVDVVQTLLRKGADPNCVSRMGAAALILALIGTNKENEERRHQIVCELIRHDADVNLRIVYADAFTFITNGKNCALSFAITSGYTSLVRMLLTAGSEVSLEEVETWTARDNTEYFFDKKEIFQPIRESKSRPQSLKHVCRKTIRSQLGPAPHSAVQALPVPTEIREYINFSDLKDYPCEKAKEVGQNLAQVTNLVDVRPCGLHVLEGTFFHASVTKEIPAATLLERPCDCVTCQKIRRAASSK